MPRPKKSLKNRMKRDAAAAGGRPWDTKSGEELLAEIDERLAKGSLGHDQFDQAELEAELKARVGFGGTVSKEMAEEHGRRAKQEKDAANKRSTDDIEKMYGFNPRTGRSRNEGR